MNENGTFWNVVWICLEPHVGLWLIWLLVLQVQNLCRVVQCSSDNGISPVKMLKKQPHSKYHQFNPTTYCPTLTTHKGKFLIKTSFGKISIFFSELFFVVCSYSVGNIISEVSSSIICISGWVIQIHEIHHTFQANRPKPFWWCILELKPPLGLMECHHGVIWPWFDSTDQNNRQQMSHLEYWNQILVHPF